MKKFTTILFCLLFLTLQTNADNNTKLYDKESLKADICLQKNNYNEAINLASKTISKNQQNILAFIVRGEAYIKLEQEIGAESDFYNAEKIFKNLNLTKQEKNKLNLDNYKYRIYKGLAKISLEHNDYKMAKEYADIALDCNEIDYEIFSLYGDINIELNNIELAENCTLISILWMDWNLKKDEKLITLSQYYNNIAQHLYLCNFDKLALYYINKALLFERKSEYLSLKSILINDNNEKEKLVNDSLLLNSNNLQAYYAKGLIAYNNKNYEEAKENFFKAMYYWTAYTKTFDYVIKDDNFLKLADCFEKIGEKDKAIIAKSMYFENLGDYKHRRGHYKEALDLFNKVQYSPNHALLLFKVGDCYDKLDNYNKALEYYNNAIKENKNLYEAYYNRGLLYCNQKKYTIAISDLSYYIKNANDENSDCNSKVELNDDIEVTYMQLAKYNRGYSFLFLDKYKEAINDIESFPNKNYTDLYNLAICYYEIGNKSLALKYLMKIINDDNAKNNEPNLYLDAVDYYKEIENKYNKSGHIQLQYTYKKSSN